MWLVAVCTINRIVFLVVWTALCRAFAGYCLIPVFVLSPIFRMNKTFGHVFLYGVLILSGNYCFSLPMASPPCAWMTGWVSFFNTINEPTGRTSWYLSDKITVLYMSAPRFIASFICCIYQTQKWVTPNFRFWRTRPILYRSEFQAVVEKLVKVS